MSRDMEGVYQTKVTEKLQKLEESKHNVNILSIHIEKYFLEADILKDHMSYLFTISRGGVINDLNKNNDLMMP